MNRSEATIHGKLVALCGVAFAVHGCSTEIYEAQVEQLSYLDLGGDWGPAGGDSNIAGTHNPPWWNTSYGFRRQTTIFTTEQLPAQYRTSLTFDHGSWVSAGKSQSNGSDVRVLFWNGSDWAQRDRFVAGPWNQNNTQIRFSTEAAVPAGTDTQYWIYYGNSAPGTAPSDLTRIFYYWSNFSSGTRFAANWSLYDTGGGSAPDYSISGGALLKGATSSAGGSTPRIADKVVLTSGAPEAGFRAVFTVAASSSGGFIGAGLCSGDSSTANDFYIGLTRAGTSLDGSAITPPAVSYWLNGAAGDSGISDDLSILHTVAIDWTSTAMKLWVNQQTLGEAPTAQWSTGPTAAGFFCLVGNDLANLTITELFLRPLVDPEPQSSLGAEEPY